MPATLNPSQPFVSLRAAVEEQLRTSPLNRLSQLDGGPIFENPLVGFADGNDPLFQQYRTIIGAFHLTPREVLERALRDAPETPHASLDSPRVIGWILPIAEATRVANRAQKDVPTIAWGHTRTFGEHFNDALRRHIVAMLRAAGYLAAAPVVEPYFRTYSEGIDRPPASVWSERHVMYAAGLGTFGLSDGFITARGIAMRCGSVVTDAPLAVTPRAIDEPYALCPELAGGTCGVCIQRCPAGAITAAGHDKARCLAYQREEIEPLRDTLYQVQTIGCGLCQVNVPCEFGIPPRAERKGSA